ncbi:conserved hypothetical protein [Pediculus humanus corporis]|uniref:Uncharacterized protein n=1 Tax=Pediculus humanus subsp. corporis TaxID=121224 RepID=E0VDJ4_PEDHC|nr:uncharacterized protein Phum_PHUM117560 [Pediculus humanus corporis]EEB11450.1 conserved hypothetical protein [Pediculus humanus corporis]
MFERAEIFHNRANKLLKSSHHNEKSTVMNENVEKKKKKHVLHNIYDDDDNDYDVEAQNFVGKISNNQRQEENREFYNDNLTLDEKFEEIRKINKVKENIVRCEENWKMKSLKQEDDNDHHHHHDDWKFDEDGYGRNKNYLENDEKMSNNLMENQTSEELNEKKSKIDFLRKKLETNTPTAGNPDILEKSLKTKKNIHPGNSYETNKNRGSVINICSRSWEVYNDQQEADSLNEPPLQDPVSLPETSEPEKPRKFYTGKHFFGNFLTSRVTTPTDMFSNTEPL